MRKTLYSLLFILLITSELMAGSASYQVASGASAATIQGYISASVGAGNSDVTLLFAKGGTWGTSASGGDITIAVPTGVTKLTLTYDPSTSGATPVLYLNTLTYSDALMTGGITLSGLKLMTGTANRYLVSSASSTNFPATVTIQNSWVEGYRAVFILGTYTNTVSNVTMTNSTFKSIGLGGIISTGAAASTVNNISITNNTFIDCNAIASSYFIDHRSTNPNSTNFNFSNNTVYLSTTQGNAAFRLTSAPTTAGHYTFSNNIYSSSATAAAYKFGYGSYSNISGTGNIYTQNFSGISTANGVSFSLYNVVPTTLFVNPSSYNFTINDVNFSGKITVGNSNCFYPETVNITGSSIVNLDYNFGTGPSTAKTFTVSTVALRGAVTFTAPADYEISSTSGSEGFASSLTLGGLNADLTNQTVWVRLKSGLSINSYNESVTVTTNLASYTPVSCSGAVTNSLPVLDTPTGLSFSSVTYTGFHASWSAVNNVTSYTLRLMLNGSTVSTINAISGTSYDLSALTPGGIYTFAITAIGDAINYNSSSESTASSNITLPYIYLYTSRNNSNAGSITPSTGTYSPNASVELRATKNFGYTFVNWIDSVSGSVLSSANPYTVTMNETKHIQAVFASVNTYKLTVNVVGGAESYQVSVSPAATVVNGYNMYEDGTVVTLTATGNPIMTFSNWSDNSTNSTLQFTMNQDQSTTATFSAADYIVGWDFYRTGSGNRTAEFYSTADNSTAALIIRKADGTTSSWLDKSILAANGYYNRGAAVNWKPFADSYYYQTSFVATDYTDISVRAGMLYNYNAKSIQKLEYSLDGTNFTTVDTYTLSAAQTWYDKTIALPADCNHAARVYVRWIPDYTSSTVGAASSNDGTSISAIYITGTQAAANDGLAPVLSSTVPVSDGAGASATGKVVLNFNKNVVITDGTTATLGSKTLTPSVSGKTVTFNYSGLSYNTTYTFTLAAGTVSDAFGNTLASAVTFSFTTMNRPVVTKKAFDFVVGVDGNFAAALSAANTASSSGNRFYIFFPDGEYNVGSLTGDANQMTTIATPKVSYVGQSSAGVVLYNQNVTEGISSTATLNFTSAASELYLQDLSLKNKDYRSGSASLGRCVVLRDQGNKNIYKNVKLLSNQDTYYTGGSIRSYLESCEIHGTVDFICGGGDIFFNECNLYLEDRTGNCITAPATSTSKGYVFSNCTIDGFATTNGNFYLGRPWQSSPRTVYINTTMNVLPTAAGWTEMGVVPTLFAEYNSINDLGASVDVSMRKSSYTYNSVTTPVSPQVLSAEQAATYTVENVLAGDDAWQPQQYTDQAGAPVITGLNRTISWDNNNYVLCWGVFKNGALVQFVTTNSYSIPEIVAEGAVYTIRAANEMGGLSDVSNAYTLAITTNPADYFRSKSTGNSSDISSWESSGDNSTWISATSVPTVAATSVDIISGHTITVNSPLNLLSLNINTGATLNVNSGVNLTLVNAFTNDGTLNLLSNASGTATIKTPATINGSGTTNVEQYLTSGRNWYISSPVSAATSNVIKSNASNSLWNYDEVNAAWNPVSATDVALAPMQGYVAKTVADGVITFTGTPNTGSKSITVYRTENGKAKRGFNLVGNPYPSYVSWVDATKTNLSTTIWYRTKTAPHPVTQATSYVFDTYNATGGVSTTLGAKLVTNLIPPMQAFWVRVAEGQTEGTVGFTNTIRGHKDDNNNLFKSPSSPNKLIRMQISNSINRDETILYFNEGASDGFDDFDSPKMFENNMSVPEIFTSAGNEELVINGSKSCGNNTCIPVGLKLGETNTYTISASQVQNFDADTKIILIDNQTSTQTDLTAGQTYTFTSDATTTTTRFSVLFKSASGTSAVNNSTDNLKIYTSDNRIIVDYNHVNASSASVSVYNGVGQKLYEQRLTGNKTTINRNFATGVYVVKVNNGVGSVTNKVIVE